MLPFHSPCTTVPSVVGNCMKNNSGYIKSCITMEESLVQLTRAHHHPFSRRFNGSIIIFLARVVTTLHNSVTLVQDLFYNTGGQVCAWCTSLSYSNSFLRIISSERIGTPVKATISCPATQKPHLPLAFKMCLVLLKVKIDFLLAILFLTLHAVHFLTLQAAANLFMHLCSVDR